MILRIEGKAHSADVASPKPKDPHYPWKVPDHDILVLRMCVKRGSIGKRELDILSGKDNPSSDRGIVVGVLDRTKTKTTIGNRILGLFVEEEENDVAKTQPTEG